MVSNIPDEVQTKRRLQSSSNQSHSVTFYLELPLVLVFYYKQKTSYRHCKVRYIMCWNANLCKWLGLPCSSWKSSDQISHILCVILQLPHVKQVTSFCKSSCTCCPYLQDPLKYFNYIMKNTEINFKLKIQFCFLSSAWW